MRKILVSALIAGSMFAATAPASAQPFRMQANVQRQIQGDISQLGNQINNATQRRTISAREATSLRRQALQVQRLYSQFARNGLNQSEVRTLQQQVNAVRQSLRLERRDWNNRRG